MTISKELFLAILSMDAYNHGYGEGITGLGGKGDKIGIATIADDANDDAGVAQAAGFYAISYTLDEAVGDLATNTTVISYRGTDDDFADPYFGYGIAAGHPDGAQATMAA